MGDRTTQNQLKNILGIDYGEKQVGIAWSDEGVYTYSLETVFEKEAIGRITFLCKEKNSERIVVGMPGGRLVQKVTEFAQKLEKETHCPVVLYDETLSTKQAQEVLIERGGSRKKRAQKEHSMSAALILQSYLDEQHTPA